MTFDAKYAGHVYGMVNGEVYVLRQDGVFTYVGAYLGEEQGSDMVTVTLTGYCATGISGNIGYQTIGGGYIFLKDGWQDMGMAAIMQYSQSQAQALVNKIINNNKVIIQNNILCARFADKLTADEKTQLYDLQTSLQERNAAIQAQGVCTNIQTSYPQGYVYLQSYLDTFMASGGVSISTAVVIIISAVVIASLSTAAYFAYKSYADQSEKDVKYSKELTQILTSRLTEEEYKQLLAETKGIVTKARIKQTLSTTSNIIWIGLAAVGGYFIYSAYKKNYKKKK